MIICLISKCFEPDILNILPVMDGESGHNIQKVSYGCRWSNTRSLRRGRCPGLTLGHLREVSRCLPRVFGGGVLPIWLWPQLFQLLLQLWQLSRLWSMCLSDTGICSTCQGGTVLPTWGGSAGFVCPSRHSVLPSDSYLVTAGGFWQWCNLQYFSQF